MYANGGLQQGRPSCTSRAGFQIMSESSETGRLASLLKRSAKCEMRPSIFLSNDEKEANEKTNKQQNNNASTSRL